ncbi:MAG: sialate O-acetylesterase [Edaphobacter sp.]|uniref:sialate O-acetylesterase n=1 Tax=Edaphobacter sp. TaxID=1934404 RepID=UPI00238BBCC7|nr:sialate O-acetylesterase [Edaphobacter sp.]MDE1178634.1 sialate O-acetylesterase [Edaphobacter sp.]
MMLRSALMPRCFLMLAAATCCLAAAHAEVTLPKILSSHMVVQRNMPIHVWGTAAPDESVTVTFHASTGTAKAGPDGRWSVYLPAEPAGGGPYTLTVKGTNTITLDDILLGDVWIASGQSNMEMPLMGFNGAPIKDSEKVIAAATRPEIRLLFVEKDSSEYPLDDAKAVKGGWSQCTPETAKTFSAAAYFFGLEIQQREKVPIGLIDTTWGGTPAEAWTSLETLSSDAGLMQVFAGRAAHMNREASERRYGEIAKAAVAAGRPAPAPRGWKPDPTSWEPAGLYNAMIAPLTPMPIRGAIWYQGEANREAGYAETYSRLFPAMIQDWRRQWRQGDFPFLFVQLSSYSIPGDSGWGLVRDAQRRTLGLTQTGMAVTLDIGEEKNIHPPDKETVGKRLALAARSVSYGEKLVASGPLYRLAYPVGDQMHVWFDEAKGLNAKGGALTGFELAGTDGNFVAATAKIEGDTVVVSSPQVAQPKFVRYAWESYSTANLYNGAGLPASTFTSFPVP